MITSKCIEYDVLQEIWNLMRLKVGNLKLKFEKDLAIMTMQSLGDLELIQNSEIKTFSCYQIMPSNYEKMGRQGEFPVKEFR